jgi:hypothetical protein
MIDGSIIGSVALEFNNLVKRFHHLLQRPFSIYLPMHEIRAAKNFTPNRFLTRIPHKGCDFGKNSLVIGGMARQNPPNQHHRKASSQGSAPVDQHRMAWLLMVLVAMRCGDEVALAVWEGLKTDCALWPLLLRLEQQVGGEVGAHLVGTTHREEWQLHLA